MKQCMKQYKNAGTIAAAAIGAAAAGYLFLIAPGRSRAGQRFPFRGQNIAHRGLYDAAQGIPENSLAAFRAAAEKLNIPIVTYWNAVDLIEDENPLYCGRAGNMGDRPGNWAIQNADLILAVGTRISIRQVGYNWKTWARAAEARAHVFQL